MPDQMPIKPRVSVIMVTYKHEAFIAKAIEGILMQNCDFEVELIIGDDCSPDGTAEIVKKYIDTHPNGHWINYTRHEINKGMMLNFIWTLEQVKGKYIALCDGDDFWTDPYKLQKQVDFLEANSEYSASMHRYKVVYENQPERQSYLQGLAEDYSAHIEDVLSFSIDGTASLVFRRELFKPFFEGFDNFKNADTAMFLVLATQGPINYFSEPMAVYSRNDGGVTNNSSFKAFNYFKETNRFLTFSDRYTNFNYSKVIFESKLKIMGWIQQDNKSRFQKIHLFFLKKYFHFCLSLLHRFQFNLNKTLKF